MVTLEDIKDIVGGVLCLGDRMNGMDASSPLLGHIPEFDSMAVVSVLTSIEDQYGVFVEDDEISAETFETLGTLHQFVKDKVNGSLA